MKSADAAKWGKAGRTTLERIPGGRQASRLATEEGIHLEGREDGHISAKENSVILPEISL